MKKLILLLLLAPLLCFAQTAPTRYYQFTNPTPLDPSVGTGVATVTNGGYTITASDVGTAITFPNNTSGVVTFPSASGTNVTVQFLWKSNYETARGRNSQILAWGGNFNIGFEYPFIYFNTPSNQVRLDMYEINNMSWETIMSGSWVHFAFVYAGSSKKIWINGQKVYDGACATGTVSGSPTISSTVDYVKVKGSIDEIAFYTSAIPERQIYQNYLDFQAGNHYQTALAPAVIPGPPTTGVLDTNEFTLNIPRTRQLSLYPGPRYKPGHTLIKNFNWMDPKFMGGVLQPGITNQQAANNGTTIQIELAKNWNYFYLLEFGYSEYANAYVAGANANPSFDLSMIFFRGQMTNPRLVSQTLPVANYLQNSFGQYLNAAGNVITDTVATKKLWRPTAPVSSYFPDGDAKYTNLTDITNRITPSNRNIKWINENGEIFPHLTDNALSNDPNVVSGKNASGLDYQSYLSLKMAENEKLSYRDRFMTHPRVQGAKFTEYSLGGQPNFGWKWPQARSINSQINGQYYSTYDIYVRWPYNWRYWVSAWHGWQWAVESRVNEIALGDKLNSPFVSAGWSATESENVRPAQWMGLLKALMGMGAEFYYAGFFSLQAPWPNSENWIWQAATPSYVQAIASRVEPFLRSGDLMASDTKANWTGSTNPGYNFYSGRANTLIVVRKITGQEKYLICSTIQNLSNTGDTPLQDTTTFTLAGQELKINIRRHGSVYVWDRTVTPNTFVQLDGWHEYKHPDRWTSDFVIEGELTDGGTGVVKTDGISGSDFTNTTSYYKGTAQYNFLPRDTATYYLYIRARSASPEGITASIGAVTQTVCIDSAAWKWVRFEADSTKALFALGSPNGYTLNVSTGVAEIDQLVLSKDSALYSPTYSSCSVAPPPPVCSWVSGAWSAWSATCITGYQYRTRTVTSSLVGCTPTDPMPATTDSTVCVCGWVTGTWSGYGACSGGYQYRTRTVTSSLSGCTPATPAPAAIDSIACVCSWITGSWSAWSACNGVFQTRTRTVVSSVSGCTPVEIMPAAVDTQSCVIPPPTCYWSAGAWSAWSECLTTTQFRTRTVTSTLVGCTPTDPKPDTIEVRSCTTVIPEVTNLRVTSRRWYTVRVEWNDSASPDLYQTELIRGTSITSNNYSGTIRRVGYTLRWNTTYTFRIRKVVGSRTSNWTQITFTTTW
jgi:hypothetical protein